MQGYGQPGGGYPPYGGPPPQQPAPGYGAPPPPQPGYGTPPPPMAGRGINKKAILVLVFAILIVVIMGVCMATPWYTQTTKGEGEESKGEFSFSGVESSYGGSSISVDWDDEGLKLYENLRNVYLITQIMVILGLVFGILLLIGAILAMIGKGPGRKLALIFGLLALIFCLLAPIIFMAMHPGALDKDYEDFAPDKGPNKSFMGSAETKDEDFGDTKQEWGPGIGWIMAWIGFIFAVIGFSFALKLPKGGYRPAPPPPDIMREPAYDGYHGTAPSPPSYPPQQPPPYPPY